MNTWTIKHADGSTIATGQTFREAATAALREEIDDNALNAEQLSDADLQGALDANDFSAHRH